MTIRTNSGNHVRSNRIADPTVVRHLHYIIGKLNAAIEEYETEALPNTRVMSSISVSKALLNSTEKELKSRL